MPRGMLAATNAARDCPAGFAPPVAFAGIDAQKSRLCHKWASSCAKASFVPQENPGKPNYDSKSDELIWGNVAGLLDLPLKTCGTSGDFARGNADLWHERHFCTTVTDGAPRDGAC